jgi:hypothetical protein
MIKQKIENNFYGEQAYLEDDQAGRKYQRIVGGMGWPASDRAGCLIVIAEERVKKHGRKPNFWVLKEFESYNISDLLNSCIVFGRRYFVSQWYADTGNAPMMAFVYRLKITLSFTNPPHLDDPNALNSYIAHIRELTLPGRKRLHFVGSSLGTRLLEIPGDKVQRATRPQDFPLLMSLGSCLSALIAWEHNPREQAEVDALNAELSSNFDF